MSDAFSSAFDALLPKEIRAEAYRDEIEMILDAAAEWDAGAMPWNIAANVGPIDRGDGNPTVGYARFVALRFTPRSDPRWYGLYRLVCKIDDMMGTRRSPQGWVLTREEVNQYETGWYPPAKAA